MRVLHVVSSGDRRGSEVFASDLVRELSLKGPALEQRVVILRSKGAPAVSFACPVVVLANISRAESSLFPTLKMVAGLRSEIRAWRPGLVQAHGGDPLKYTLLAGLGLNVMVVYRRIGCAPRWMLTGTRRLLWRFLMKRADAVVAVADAVRREAVGLFGLDEERLVTIPNGVDPSRIAPDHGRDGLRRELGIPSQAAALLSMGSLSWEKDPLGVVAIMAGVLRGRDDVFALIAGDGALRNDVKRAIDASGVRDRFRLLGSRADVGDILAASDVFVFASRSDGMEGMPGAVIEAAMAGLSVVAYDVAGVREVITDCGGVLVPAGDGAEMGAALERMLATRTAGRDVREEARIRCTASFAIGPVADAYVNLYRKLAPV